MNHVLVIEDNAECQHLVSVALGPQFECKMVTSVKSGLENLSKFPFDAVLVDINLPDGSGFDLISKLPGFSLNQDTPILILSAREGVSDKVHGFSLGADDYITKPFDALELRARVEAKISKRMRKAAVVIDGLHIEPSFQRVFKSENGGKTDLQLTPIEFKILFALVESKGRPLSREELTSRVWDKDHSFESRGIDAHVSNLRKKLGSHSKVVGSVYGVGYVYRPLSNSLHKAI